MKPPLLLADLTLKTKLLTAFHRQRVLHTKVGNVLLPKSYGKLHRPTLFFGVRSPKRTPDGSLDSGYLCKEHLPALFDATAPWLISGDVPLDAGHVVD